VCVFDFTHGLMYGWGVPPLQQPVCGRAAK
jgi:hypothetical protein